MFQSIIKYITPFLLIGSLVFAQNKYSLNDCKKLALKNNIKLNNSTLSVNAAEEAKKNAYTKYFPNLSISGNYFKSSDKLMVNKLNLDGNVLSLPVLDEVLSGSVNLMQPLYTGGRIKTGNELAELDIDVKTLSKALIRNEVLKNTEQLFWQLIELKEKHKTIISYENLLTKLYKQVSDAKAAGLATRNDLLKVKISQSEVKINKTKLENGIELSRLALCQYIGLPMDKNSLFEDVITTLSLPEQFFVDPVKALSKRKETRLLEKGVKAEELKTDLTRGELLPTLSVGVNGFYLDVLDNEGEFYTSFMGNVSIPISDWWGGSHALSEREIKEQIAVNQMKDSKELMVLQIHKAWNDLVEKYKQVNLAEETVEQTTENLSLNEDSYNNGLTEISDLLQAKAKYQESLDRLIEAKASYKIQIAVYLQVTGSDL
ncbi:MAG: TolC family protein [Rhodothermaceae bacterium]